MKETTSKGSNVCAIETKASVGTKEAVVFAHNAIMMSVDLRITNNETGEVLFHYANKAVQWIDGDLARELLIV